MTEKTDQTDQTETKKTETKKTTAPVSGGMSDLEMLVAAIYAAGHVMRYGNNKKIEDIVSDAKRFVAELQRKGA